MAGRDTITRYILFPAECAKLAEDTHNHICSSTHWLLGEVLHDAMMQAYAREAMGASAQWVQNASLCAASMLSMLLIGGHGSPAGRSVNTEE